MSSGVGGRISLLIRDVQVHERTHSWAWPSKREFVRFVAWNKAPSIQVYMEGWSVQEREEVASVIGGMLDREFPGRDGFNVPMIANIVVGRKA
jgi:hypothetical protein